MVNLIIIKNIEEIGIRVGKEKEIILIIDESH